jgi:hypothetical protein
VQERGGVSRIPCVLSIASDGIFVQPDQYGFSWISNDGYMNFSGSSIAV